ncbi:MAG TPA: hypothetical protein VGD67_08325 [Pseudonocardiaceae bacterium]
MSRYVVLALAALVAVTLVSCGVRPESRPVPIDQTTQETAPTPSFDRNPGPTLTSTSTTTPPSPTPTPTP